MLYLIVMVWLMTWMILITILILTITTTIHSPCHCKMPCGTSILAVFCQWSVFQRTFDPCSPGIQISHTLYPNRINVAVFFGTWWHLPRNPSPSRQTVACLFFYASRGQRVLEIFTNRPSFSFSRGKETGIPFFDDLWEISILPTCLFFFVWDSVQGPNWCGRWTKRRGKDGIKVVKDGRPQFEDEALGTFLFFPTSCREEVSTKVI